MTPPEPPAPTGWGWPAAVIAAFLASIVAANIATTHLGMIPVGLGLTATAGTYFAGATFILRDLVDDIAGRPAVFAGVAVGGLLSFTLAAPQIAVASVAAFVLSELIDAAVYWPLRRRGYARAAVASNVAGAIVDSIVFLGLAGFPILPALPGQMFAKLTVTAFTVAAVLIIRRVLLRKPDRI